MARKILFLFLAVISSVFLANISVAWADQWESVGQSDGVDVYRMQVQGSPMLAFRGEVVADVHISKIMEVFTNSEERGRWVDRYHSHETLEQTNRTELYWIRFSLPPGISDRDYLLRANLEVDEEAKTVTARLRSVVDRRWPEQGCCVRAYTETFYEFEALSGNRTRMVVEVHTDPKGRLPAWLVNRIQRGWPSTTLSNLIARAKAPEIESHSEYKDW